MQISIESTVELNNGVRIYRLGFGTWALRGKTAINAVSWAIETGYRLIDTASFYGNENEVGKAIKESKVDRDDLFITTKVWDSEQGYDKALEAFDRSKSKLGIDVLDLYLIHWPRDKRLETWKALEKLYKEEKVSAIGVSNFTIEQLKELFQNSTIKPVVNQIEFHPFLYQKNLLNFCEDNEIRVEAYAPLTRAEKFNNPIIQEISSKYNKTPAQILIRWGLQQGVIEIPKSSSKQHIIENAQVFDFDISDKDFEKLNNLNENYRLVEDMVFN
ncbi:MAG: aldo/keto reductase [Candidatus Lokiarchaeota archaeon]|nr:aldo/keto reductase [Candidatus Lokiarchaeota archaeon]MBD3200660.1 aldo/keto reductase [Candidatus Lokiarchaeota archaeon]